MLSLRVLLLFATILANLVVDRGQRKEHLCNKVSPALTVSGTPARPKSQAEPMNDFGVQKKGYGLGIVADLGAKTAVISEVGLKDNDLGS